MTIQEMINHVDHTLLKPFATWEEIQVICDEAIELHTASVCIPPCYVAPVKEKYGDTLKICTVIGFPLGYNTTVTKIFETENAILNGADEIDMVINVGFMKAGNYDAVLEEIRALRKSCHGKVLKVIIETCYLSEEEIKKASELVTIAGADYIKTSTGFGTAGATVENVKLMKENIGPDVKIKAAGGIRTKEALQEFIELGCDRVGASATKQFLE
ncbi:MAG: deoxyribose-phosphate aldolase [Lachnospiraceae bacterium]|nr:deoxyribose-phosphate aldolase [Lachnospiraceae bacterium]MBR6848712.1 deoxyribose-phosphate aldolase [Lachnospiraceae bacterium]